MSWFGLDPYFYGFVWIDLKSNSNQLMLTSNNGTASGNFFFKRTSDFILSFTLLFFQSIYRFQSGWTNSGFGWVRINSIKFHINWVGKKEMIQTQIELVIWFEHSYDRIINLCLCVHCDSDRIRFLIGSDHDRFGFFIRIQFELEFCRSSYCCSV